MRKIILILCIAAVSCTNAPKEEQAARVSGVPLIPYTVMNMFPHDTLSFTEGLLIHDGQLWESTGHTDSYPFSRSVFGIVDRKTGKIDVKGEIDKEKYFGEGIAFLKDRVYQLTDTTRIGFIWDAKTFKRLGEFHYAEDGWAFTTNGTWLIMSSGTSVVRYRDPVSFETVKTLNITEDSAAVGNVNELELINGYLYANQWLTSYILKIDTSSGKVVGKLDLSALSAEAKQAYPGAAEMNGIAYDPVQNKVFITGKLWPSFYEIKFDH